MSLAVVVHVSLGTVAILGYYATAQTLAMCVFDTLWLLFSLMVINGLVKRWILVRRRKLAMDQFRQRRASLAADPNASSLLASENVAVDASDEVDLSAVSLQTKQLTQTVLLLLGFSLGWTIWSNVFPALNMLRYVPALPGLSTISLAKVLLAGLIGVVTFIATRNVPGLLELVLLNYLPVDAGARFATTTVCRYGIALSGIWLVGERLSIQWQSIQWLVAAMGIGLGFGLQEIFANFISGIILLFERPIRVGDVVTMGETTGVVTRIRLRATTITDWDRKEFIVPNRDLITGRLLNWTLSDQTNRIVIKVGVAYGTDTDSACQLLESVARKCPEVLKDPPPIATFEGFGDSSLQLTLRCFLPNLERRLQTVHKLHSEIDQAFRDENIEIPFPQREYRVRQVA
ncbi:MAG: mechanosensitive ion channel, partial [Planctomycetota bacterium]|nr:mechanosensitive ion channel [Planctomycetota bacterium]